MNSLINKGISRVNRFPKNLDSSSVAIDSRDFSDLMNMAMEFASLFRFYDKDNIHQKYWNEFFLRDNLFILSAIAKTSYEDFQKMFEMQTETFYLVRNEKIQNLILRYNGMVILYMAKLIDTWFVNLSKDSTKRNLASELSDAIQSRLSKDISQINQWGEWGKQKGIIDESMLKVLNELDSIWEVEGTNTTDTTNWDYDAVIGIQSNIFRNFYDTIIYLVRLAPSGLDSSLNDIQNHNPHIALFVTFLKLFQHAQAKMNSITQRHLDFYYTEILRQEKKKPAAGSVFLSFTLNEGFDPYLLKSGNRLRAGKDKNGQDILYKTTDDLVVSKAFIKHIKTLYTVKKQSAISKIYVASFDPKDEKNGWPTIGGVPEDFMDPTIVQEPILGFMVAAPIWATQEGNRIFLVTIYIDHVQTNTEYAPWKDTDLTSYFKLLLTGKEAWLEIKNHKMTHDVDKITFSFELGADLPPIVGNSKLFDSDDEVPVLKAVFVPAAEGDSPIAYLEGIIVKSISINLKVKGLKSLSVFNKYGKIDASKPFEPFGPAPEKKDYFVIGSNEVFSKRASSVSFDLQWEGLPEENLGTYYQSYDTKVTNQTFKVKLSILRDGTWMPLPDNSQLYALFSSHKDKDGKEITDISTSWKDIDMTCVPDSVQPVYGEKGDEFNSFTKNNFIKIELAEPSWAFGHAVYPVKYADISYKNNVPDIVIDKKTGKMTEYKTKTEAEKLPLPNPPVTPVLGSFLMDYEATEYINPQTVNSGTNQYYQLLSFGYKKLKNEDIETQKWTLFNNYSNRHGCLYIGIGNLDPPETLTFFFKLEEEQVMDQKGINSEWTYLSNDEWKPILDNQHIVLDTTNKLSHSGILKLEIPDDITHKNKSMPADDCSWLRFTSAPGAYFASWTYGIHIHSVAATWDSQANNDYSYLATPLPPGSVSSLVEVTPAIDKIIQPYYSFGNQAEETQEDYYMRVSERLHHKQRAVTSYDYERLVLERFSFINKVVCLQATKSGKNQQSQATPGSVIIVVTQFIKNRDMLDPSHILVNSSNLNLIREYLMQYCSPFVQMEVKNPLFERLKVEAEIFFAKGCNNKFYLNTLSDEINRYLCPWLYNDDEEVVMGTSISLLDLLGFLEKRDYIESIGKLQVRLPDSDNKVFIYSPDNSDHNIEVTNDWSVIIPNDKHQFTILNN